MFQRPDGSFGLTIRGTAATLVWGYHTAAVCAAWSITRVQAEWRLSATLTRQDPFLLCQRPLIFVAASGTRFVLDVHRVESGPTSLRATVGTPIEETEGAQHGAFAVRAAGSRAAGTQ